jgi:hypothetical protein
MVATMLGICFLSAAAVYLIADVGERQQGARKLKFTRGSTRAPLGLVQPSKIRTTTYLRLKIMLKSDPATGSALFPLWFPIQGHPALSSINYRA